MRNISILLFTLFIASGCSSYKNTSDFVFPEQKGKEKYLNAYEQTIQLWNVPIEEANVETSYGTAHVVMCGPKTAETIVLFHGMDASSTMWYPNVKDLSRNYRVYAIDFPLEAGKSLACGDRISVPEIMQFYKEVFQHFHLKDINLIGASRGGWMATNVALEPGNDIKRLILLSPAQTFGALKKPFKVLTAVSLKLFPSQKRLDKFFRTFAVHPEKIDDKYKQQFYYANVYGKSKPNFITMVRISEKKLRTLKIPVLVLIGDHDIVNDGKAIERANEYIPDVETELITDAGHFLSIDQSAVVDHRILDFLNKPDHADHQLSSIQNP